MCCFASIDEGWAHGLLEQLEAGAACGTLFSGGGWRACGAQCVGGPRARVLTGFRQERRRGAESARCEQLERRAMVLARTLDCVRGVRLGAKDRLFAELEDEEEAMGARCRAQRSRKLVSLGVARATGCRVWCVGTWLTRMRVLPPQVGSGATGRSHAGAADQWRVFRGRWRSRGRDGAGCAIWPSPVGGDVGSGCTAAAPARSWNIATETGSARRRNRPLGKTRRMGRTAKTARE